MALLRNGSNLMTNTCRAYSGVTSNLGGGIATLRGNFDKSGAHRNFSAGEAAVYKVSDKSGAPNGYGGKGWLIPIKSGAANSRKRAVLTVGGALGGALGISSPITADITVSSTLQGGLVVAGTVSALIAISAAFDASAVVGGAINTTITVDSTFDPALVAHGDMAATMTITGDIDAVLLAFADMNSDYGTELTAAQVADEVWNSVAGGFNRTGTMGEKLNDAGSAANPWTEVIESGYTAEEVLRILFAVAAGRTTITDLGNGAATVVFKSQNGVVDRLTADMEGSERIEITLDPS